MEAKRIRRIVSRLFMATVHPKARRDRTAVIITAPWTDISAYDTDFTIVTNVAVDDSETFWLRIQTPVNTSFCTEHPSTLTVTAYEY